MNARTFVVAGLLAAAAVCGARADDQTPSPRAPDVKGVPAGYRGMSISLPGTQLAYIKAGDRLDVLVTFDANMEKNVKEKMTATILQNVLVIGVQRPEKLSDRGAVEFLVNPNEGQYMALALVQGEVHVLVRAEGDLEMHPLEMASFRKLFR